jgi:hypothetical protein
LLLQIKSKLLAEGVGSEPRRRIYFPHLRQSIAGFWPLLPHPACERAMTGPLFANRLEVVSDNPAVARRICQSSRHERLQPDNV